jgi:hypothetical protein
MGSGILAGLAIWSDQQRVNNGTVTFAAASLDGVFFAVDGLEAEPMRPALLRVPVVR